MTEMFDGHRTPEATLYNVSHTEKKSKSQFLESWLFEYPRFLQDVTVCVIAGDKELS